MSKTKRGYSDKLKEQAFRLYRQHNGSARRVSRELDGRPSHVTITEWAEKEDWDGKIVESQNVVRKMLGISKDPLVKKLAQDDVFVVEVLSLLQGIAIKTIRRKRNRIIPKNTNELVKLLQFISTEYRLRAGSDDKSKVQENAGVSKHSLRDFIKEELGDTPEAQEAATSLITSLRTEVRTLRKKKMREETRNIEAS